MFELFREHKTHVVEGNCGVYVKFDHLDDEMRKVVNLGNLLLHLKYSILILMQFSKTCKVPISHCEARSRTTKSLID